MKRLISAFLAIVMLVTAVPVMADNSSGAATVANNVAEKTNHGDGVVLRKTAIPHIGPDGKPDGTIDINIEAYTTGVVTNTTKITPTDIVLELDMSGSMDSGAAYETVIHTTK